MSGGCRVGVGRGVMLCVGQVSGGCRAWCQGGVGEVSGRCRRGCRGGVGEVSERLSGRCRGGVREVSGWFDVRMVSEVSGGVGEVSGRCRGGVGVSVLEELEICWRVMVRR